MPRITRSTNPEREKYPREAGERIETPDLGVIHIQVNCDDLAGNPGKYRSSYTLQVHIDDTLTINGRTYDNVRASTRDYNDTFKADHMMVEYHYGTMPTDAARATIRAALAPYVADFLTRHGAERLMWQARNDKRRADASYQRREAQSHIDNAERIEATIEPDPFTPQPDPQLDAEVNHLLARAQGFTNAGAMFDSMITTER